MRIVLLSIAALVLIPALSLAQSPRAPDGHPGLQGYWSNATRTPSGPSKFR